MLIVKILLTLRSETNFDLFWKKARMRGAEWDVEGSQLPRRRKTQRRYEEGTSEGSFHTTVESLYRKNYFEVITSRFDQEGFCIYSSVEQLLVNTASGEGTEFSVVCEQDFEMS